MGTRSPVAVFVLGKAKGEEQRAKSLVAIGATKGLFWRYRPENDTHALAITTSKECVRRGNECLEVIHTVSK